MLTHLLQAYSNLRQTISVKGISVVIPNYNGRHLLEMILPPLFIALDNCLLPYEVIISDDLSKDDSIQFLKSSYPGIFIIENDRNRGFSPTINAGIFKAKFDLVLLLNSDVKLEPGYFKNLLRYFEKPDTFGVMGRIIGWDDEITQDGAKYPGFHGNKIKTSGNYLPENPSENDWLYSMYLSGANALVDRHKLLTLGGFDEIFAPFYVEDYELSLRAWRAGFKCYFDYYSVCRHKVSVSIKTKHKKSFINAIYYRNKMFLHAIHLNGSAFIAWYIQNFLEVTFQSLIGKTYFIKGYIQFVNNSARWKQSKKRFDNLCEQKKVNLGVRDVTSFILDSLNNIKIRKI